MFRKKYLLFLIFILSTTSCKNENFKALKNEYIRFYNQFNEKYNGNFSLESDYYSIKATKVDNSDSMKIENISYNGFLEETFSERVNDTVFLCTNFTYSNSTFRFEDNVLKSSNIENWMFDGENVYNEEIKRLDARPNDENYLTKLTYGIKNEDFKFYLRNASYFDIIGKEQLNKLKPFKKLESNKDYPSLYDSESRIYDIVASRDSFSTDKEWTLSFTKLSTFTAYKDSVYVFTTPVYFEYVFDKKMNFVSMRFVHKKFIDNYYCYDICKTTENVVNVPKEYENPITHKEWWFSL